MTLRLVKEVAPTLYHAAPFPSLWSSKSSRLPSKRREAPAPICRREVIMDLSVEQLEAVEVLADQAVPMPEISERTGLPLETVELILYGPDSDD
jgi:hypothetical protein